MLLLSLSFAVAVAGGGGQTPQGCAPATGFVGTICASKTPGKHPAILLLGGSGGGDDLARVAPRFAQRGYVAASVAYFNAPGLPQTLENVPVETVGKALAEIAQRPDVDARRIAVLGGSKGGELALLAASTYSQIRAVVADVPSPFAWEGIAQGPGAPASSWTLRGKAVPYVAYAPAMGQAIAAAFTEHKPLDLRPGYEASMQQNAGEIPAAMFHLENIRGPVLMIAAGDDQIWDSQAQCKIGMDYLRAHHHPYADAYLEYPKAGHVFLFSSPGHPLTQAQMGPIPMLLGGSAESNEDAAAAAWPKIDAFLTAALQ